MMFKTAFKTNIEALEKVIEILGKDVNNTENKELYQEALREYRLWIKLYLDHKSQIEIEPELTREEMISNFFKMCNEAKLPKKYIVRMRKCLKRYEEEDLI